MIISFQDQEQDRSVLRSGSLVPRTFPTSVCHWQHEKYFQTLSTDFPYCKLTTIKRAIMAHLPTLLWCVPMYSL